jgi:hypothetical protein
VPQFKKAAISDSRSWLKSLEWCLGQSIPWGGGDCLVVFVRGETKDGAFFAGLVELPEARIVPPHDIRVYGVPADSAVVAGAIDTALATTPAARLAFHKALQGDE